MHANTHLIHRPAREGARLNAHVHVNMYVHITGLAVGIPNSVRVSLGKRDVYIFVIPSAEVKLKITRAYVCLH